MRNFIDLDETQSSIDTSHWGEVRSRSKATAAEPPPAQQQDCSVDDGDPADEKRDRDRNPGHPLVRDDLQVGQLRLRRDSCSRYCEMLLCS